MQTITLKRTKTHYYTYLTNIDPTKKHYVIRQDTIDKFRQLQAMCFEVDRKLLLLYTKNIIKLRELEQLLLQLVPIREVRIYNIRGRYQVVAPISLGKEQEIRALLLSEDELNKLARDLAFSIWCYILHRLQKAGNALEKLITTLEKLKT